MQGFVRELMEFVQLDDTDVATIRRTAPAILRHEQAITAALYEHFLKFPATARFFLKDDGTPDPQRLERRKHSLGRWLRETAEVAMTHLNLDTQPEVVRQFVLELSVSGEGVVLDVVGAWSPPPEGQATATRASAAATARRRRTGRSVPTGPVMPSAPLVTQRSH